MTRPSSLLFALLLLPGPATAFAAPQAGRSPASATPATQIRAALDRGDYASALSIIKNHLNGKPDDPRLLYQAGCAAACLGDDEEAVAFLARAVNAGFIDYALMRVDPELESVRAHPVYKAIIEEADRILEQWRADPVHTWQERFGTEGYRFEHDDERGLWFASALDDTAHRAMRSMLEREADYLAKAFFDGPPGYDVLVAAPTAEHGSRIFNGKDRYGGVYEHASRRLVARDIGSSLRHEFFHLMHFGHMQRLGRLQPIWIQEGWASLYEDCVFPLEGGARLMPSHRHDVVHALSERGELLPLVTLLSMDQTQFMADAGRAYAQSRSIFHFLADRELLEGWYRVYVDSYDADPSGARALEEVFGTPLSRIERDWKSWLGRRPPPPIRVHLGEPGLGITTIMRGSNDGVFITDVVEDSEPHRAGLCPGDVIVAIDDQATRSFLELRAIVGRRRPGTWVEFRVRRGDDYIDLPVKLSPLDR